MGRTVRDPCRWPPAPPRGLPSIQPSPAQSPPPRQKRGTAEGASRRSEGPSVASGRERFSIISDGLPTQLPDIDPNETREWVDSFDTVVRTRGRARARYVM